MVLPESRGELFRWLEEFNSLDKPVIAKFRADAIPDYSPIMDYIEGLDLLGVHFNIRGADGRPNYSFLEGLRRYSDTFILVSGYIWSVEAVRRVFELGADMVGIAEPTREDSSFIEKLIASLRKS